MGEEFMFPIFMGTKEHTIDDKGRLFLPAEYREYLGGTLVVCKDMQHDCLSLYLYKDFAAFAKTLKSLPRNYKETSNIILSIIGNAKSVNMDKQGRIKISDELQKLVGIDKNASIVGSIDHFEIWAKDKLTDQQGSIDLEVEAKSLADKGIEISYNV